MTAPVSVAEVGKALQHFAWLDYAVFAVMLIMCALIGIYFGYFAPAKQDEDEYLMGGRRMSTLPIALSLVASYVSGTTILGLPTEVYVYGTQVLYFMVGMVVFGVIFTTSILPVFHDLQLITLYQYLHMRFDRRVRLLGSILFSIMMVTWLPVVIYVPALAFNQVTGINVHIISPITCAVCIFYTCVGGMKAVVWTDVVQTVSMVGCLLLVMVRGTYMVGGPCVVFEHAIDSGRLEAPIFDVDPLIRQTFWAAAIAALCNSTVGSGVNQAMMQRYLALPNIRQARRAVWMFLIGVSLLCFFSAYCGLLIFATYHDCDPVTTQLARAKDQVLPLLVMDTLGSFPGLPGLFVAGVFSAALSSLSTGLNSMAAVVVEDFWRPMCSKEPSERAVNIVLRVVVVVFGVVSVSLVFIVEKLGVILQASSSLGSITSGPTLAVFLEALFIPWVNSTGCLAGAGAGLTFMSWLIFGAQRAIARGELKFPEKPVSVEGCTYLFNSTGLANSTLDFGYSSKEADPLWIFRISYNWYAPLGVLISLLVALTVSLATRGGKGPTHLDARLVSPLVRKFLPQMRPPVLGADCEESMAVDNLKIVKREDNGKSPTDSIL